MAAVSTSSDSEDVADFLRRIKELGEKRDQEDAERTRKLEEDIRESRQKRAARRAEREQSLSPEKSSPAGSPVATHSRRGLSRSDTPILSPLGTPRLPAHDNDTRSSSRPDSPTTKPDNPIRERPPRGMSRSETPVLSPLGTPRLSASETETRSSSRPESPTAKPETFIRERPPQPPKPTSSSSLSRSGTLSWQQRPGSVRGPRSRPLSLADQSSPSDSPGRKTDNSPLQEAAPSRDQIAQSLGTRDPEWFRQTADRGLGSKALRRDTDAQQETNDSSKQPLPGMLREPTESRERTKSRERKASDIYLGSVRGAADVRRPSTGAVRAGTPVSTSLPLRFSGKEEEGPTIATHASSNEVLAPVSPTPSRPRFERPESPTKGMGGFVQSAMLKRSDSLSKRWSAQPGLSRQDSVGRDRTQRFELSTSTSMPRLGESDRTPDTKPDSKPSSVHGNTTPGGKSTLDLRDGRQTLRPDSRPVSRDTSPTRADDVNAPPSPSKRFSPLKSSWLESALNKPDTPPSSPKPLLNQPSWMVELNKAKQQRSSRDLTPATEKSAAMASISAGPKAEVGMDSPQTIAGPTPAAEKQSSSTIVSSAPATLRSLGPDTDRTPSISSLSTTTAKPKPDTPTKKDFRSTLKSRQAPIDEPKQEGLEFQNAFGRLKRTQTQNYKAPDELKDNIMRGKSGLNASAGPQKTTRRDELKEDLLKQKEAMKAKAEEPQQENKDIRKVSRSATPEAIARRRALSSNVSSGNISGSPSRSTSKEEAPEVMSISASHSTEKAAVVSPESQPLAKTLSNKFADRFNPALAGVLARGPSPSQGPSKDASHETTSARPIMTDEATDDSTPGHDSTPGQLQHMTKARARGPKRRAPKVTASSSPAASDSKDETAPGRSTPEAAPTKPLVTAKPRNITPNTLTAAPVKPSIRNVSGPKPPTAPKSPQLTRELSNNSLRSPAPDVKAPADTISAVQNSTSSPTLKTPKPLQIINKPPTTGTAVPASPPKLSVKNATAIWSQSPVRSSPVIKEPIKLPTRKDEDIRNRVVDTATRTPPQSSGLTDRPSDRLSPSKAAATSTSSTSKPRLAGVKDAPPKPRTSSSNIGQRTPSSQASEPKKVFTDFFGETPVASRELEVDANDILERGTTSQAKIKTLQKHISELGRDGRSTPVSSDQEHILYSDRMYLCTHVFGDSAGARLSEVYLWTGSDVADSTIDDAQIFAKRAAKEANAKLFSFRQGKEPENFFQALGGIVITRKASPSSNNPGQYILCGRQHLGHLAFDEVPFSLNTFSSAYPHIVYAGPNKVYLWKGVGCTTEELSGARLISMDMCPSGLVTELDDGSETPDFLSLFTPNTSTPRSASYWAQKPKHESYRTRLFKIEWHERPVSRHNSGPAQALWGMVRRQSQPAPTHLRIEELTPFAQRDIETEGLYVLDGWFEVFVIVTPLAHKQSRAFACALLFAQEYSILATSAENRPAVPAGVVVMGELPKDAKACFRGWDDGRIATGGLMAGSGKGKSNAEGRVVPLSVALAAVRG